VAEEEAPLVMPPSQTLSKTLRFEEEEEEAEAVMSDEQIGWAFRLLNISGAERTAMRPVSFAQLVRSLTQDLDVHQEMVRTCPGHLLDADRFLKKLI
jgi:hypothetical protein